MSQRDDIASHGNFYKTYKLRNSSLVLFLILFSLGFYAIWWFYLIARDFKSIEKNAPSENRALFVSLIIPCSFFLIFFLIEEILSLNNVMLLLIKNWGWVFIAFLMIKYLYDFTQSYGKFTKTIGFYWFLGFLFGFLGVLAVAFYNFYLAPLIFIFPIIIPAMQAQFNFWVDRLNIKKKSNAFYF